MNISVLGLGYIGLPTAAMLAQAGHVVYGYDVNGALLEELRAGRVSIGEPEVRALTQAAIETGYLLVSEVVPRADAYIVCVPTPTVGNRPDLRCVEDAAARIAAVAPRGSMIVLESTVPPRTTERIFEAAFASAGKSIDEMCVAHCPERVLPGAIVHELRYNARIVGGRRPEDARAVRKLYETFCKGDITETDCVTAELSKVVENTYRDVNIAFANELALLAEELGVDVWETIALANMHPRVNILAPGPGVGGHCIPVDPHFLSNANPFVTELIQTARRVNHRMPYRIAHRVCEFLPGNAFGKRVAIFGAAYKRDVDDARESPALDIFALLRERGIETTIYDPLVRSCGVPLAATVQEALREADVLVIATDHSQFASLEPAEVMALMRGRAIVDARRMLDADRWRRAGFDLYVLGEKPPAAAARAAVA